MELDANKYNKSNTLQIRDAKELIDRIVEENSDKKYDIILDIGCGSGNVTLILDSVLNAHQIYAIDVDHHMIEFAKQNHSKDKIRYFAQDFGLEWHQLAPELRSIEGKVSLIFSNHCLHWIKNKENVVKNLYRLLSKSGQIYANIYWISDIYADLAPEEKAVHEREFLSIPTKDTQLNIWLDLFRSVDFTVTAHDFLAKAYTYERNNYIENMLPLSLTIRKQYFVEKDFNKVRERSDEYFAKVMTRCRPFKDPTTGADMLEFPYGYFQFKLEK